MYRKVTYAQLCKPFFPGFTLAKFDDNTTGFATIEPELFNQWKELGFEGYADLEEAKDGNGQTIWRAKSILRVSPYD